MGLWCRGQRHGETGENRNRTHCRLQQCKGKQCETLHGAMLHGETAKAVIVEDTIVGKMVWGAPLQDTAWVDVAGEESTG